MFHAIQRFWALSWWWKGPILGVVAFVTLSIGAAVAGGGDSGKQAVLEEPTTTATVALTPTPQPTVELTRPPTEEPTPTLEPTAKPTPKPTPVPTAPAPVVTEPAAQVCHPSYEGACLLQNAGDYDCAGGSGNGPNYTGRVRVVGPDAFDLDRDGDGIGCE